MTGWPVLLVLLVLVVVRHLGDVRQVSVTYAATAAGVVPAEVPEVRVLLVLVVVQLHAASCSCTRRSLWRGETGGFRNA